MRAEGQLDRVTRRAFLHLAGRGALALEALGVAPRPRGQPWDELDGLRGAVVRPGAAAYGTARLGWNQRHDGVLPRAIVQCADVDDVRRTLAWARRHDLWGVPRAGGHSYAGYSLCDGVVLDVARLKRLSVDAATRTAVVGAGNRLGDV